MYKVKNVLFFIPLKTYNADKSINPRRNTNKITDKPDYRGLINLRILELPTH